MTLERIRIQNGYAPDGGGILINNAALTLVETHFINCTADRGVPGSLTGVGGGLFSWISKPFQSDASGMVTLRIDQCFFDSCHAKGMGGSVAISGPQNGSDFIGLHVEVGRSHFRDSSHSNDSVDSVGGAISIVPFEGKLFEHPDKILGNSSLELRDNYFINCRSARNGGVLAVNFNTIEGMRTRCVKNVFRSCSAVVSGGSLYWLSFVRDRDWQFTIEGNVFEDSMGLFEGGAIGIYSWGLETEGMLVTTRSNSFKRCRARSPGGNGGAFLIGSAGHATNSTFNSIGDEFICCTSESNGGGLAISIGTAGYQINVSVSDAFFYNVRAGQGGGMYVVSPRFISLKVSLNECKVNNSTATVNGGFFTMLSGRFSSSFVDMKGLSLDDTQAHQSGGSLYFSGGSDSTKTVSQELSPFPDCECEVGALPDPLVDALLPVSVRNSVFTNVIANQNGGIAYAHNCELNITHVNATGLWAGLSGAVAFVDDWSSLNLRQVTFEVSGTESGGVIQHEGRGDFSISSVSGATEPSTKGQSYTLLSILQSRTIDIEMSQLYCGEFHRLRKTANMSASLTQMWPAESLSDLFCGSCPSFTLVEMPVNQRTLVCEVCKQNSYILEAGFMEDEVLSNTECFDCPFRALCSGDSSPKALQGHWGATVEGTKVSELVRCPPGYCCTNPEGDPPVCSSYNVCSTLRTGFGCGKCLEGATEQIGASGCIKEDECRTALHRMMWIFAIVFMLFIASVVILLSNRKRNTQAKEDARSTLSIANLMIYFYQIIGMVSVATDEGQNDFLHRVSQAAKLSPPLPYGWCPFIGLTSVSKELFRALIGPTLVLFVCLFKMVHLHFKSHKSPRECKPCRYDAVTYYIAILKMSLLTYASVGEAVQKILTCVAVPQHGIRTSVDMSYYCGEPWWWWAAFLWFVFGIICAPIVIALGLQGLRKRYVETREFSASILFPFPMLCVWARRYLKERKTLTVPVSTDRSFSKATIDSCDLVFRDLSENFRPGYRLWEATLVARRLLFVCISFIPNIFFQSLFNTVASVTFLLVQEMFRPYQTRKENAFESLSLWLLCIISALNMTRSRLLKLERMTL